MERWDDEIALRCRYFLQVTVPTRLLLEQVKTGMENDVPNLLESDISNLLSHVLQGLSR